LKQLNYQEVLDTDKQVPLVWLVIIMSCIPFAIYQSEGLAEISAWFMPTQLTQLLEPLNTWKLWSPTFVHYTFPHLLTNITLWWLFAGKIERESRIELFVIFTLIATCANLSQWYMTGPKFGGLSGVVYGLMGYLTVHYYVGNKKKYHIDPALVILMLALIPLSFSDMLGKLSIYAHIGGLISGCLLAFAHLSFYSRYKTH